MTYLSRWSRRIIVAAAVVPALLNVLPSTARATLPQRMERKVDQRICDYDWKASKHEVKQLIRCAAHHWGSPGGANKALDVARCESGFQPDAYNPSGYAGVYQQAVRYWPDRAHKWGFPHRSAYNGRANIIVSIRMANSANGWRIWSCG
ncbi:MAG TPA: hypothetical protein VI007_08970 [bacterium]